jgi:hypothetical protein
MKYVKQQMVKEGYDRGKIEEEVIVGNRRVDVMYVDEEEPIAVECKTFKHTEEGLEEYAQKNPGHRRILVMPLFSADEIWFIGDSKDKKVIKLVINEELSAKRASSTGRREEGGLEAANR